MTATDADALTRPAQSMLVAVDSLAGGIVAQAVRGFTPLIAALDQLAP